MRCSEAKVKVGGKSLSCGAQAQTGEDNVNGRKKRSSALNVRHTEFETYDRTGIGFSGRLNLSRDRFERMDAFGQRQAI